VLIGLNKMSYQVDERVGCIAVVDDSHEYICLTADMDGVVAFWQGERGKKSGEWIVPQWQRDKAKNLCDLLNSAW